MPHFLPLSLPFHLWFQFTKRSRPRLLGVSLLLLLLGPGASAQPAAGVGSTTDCPVRPATITGGGCVGSPLAVSIDYPAAGIVWQQGNTVVKTALPSYTVNGITIAGGNGGGGKANQLNQPIGITVDKSGNLYVADQENHRVQRWAPGAAFGVTVAGGNGAGNNPNQFNQPFGVAVDDNGNLYVTDMLNHRVQRWAPEATEGVTVAGSNSAGGNASQFDRPAGIIIDESGNLYVADSYNSRIQKWTPGATEGVTVAGGNGAGSRADQFHLPYTVAVDHSGNLYVADVGNYRVQWWAPGATQGVTVAVGNEQNAFTRPAAVSTDVNGNLYVSDFINHRVQRWVPGAAQAVTVAGFNGRGSGADQFDSPRGVAIDGKGNLYVADGNNHRIQQFSPTIDATYTPAEAGTYTATVRTFNGCTAGAAPVAITEGLPATLSGGGCVGSPLTLNFAYPAADIVWRKGTAVVKTTFAAYPANGVSAAGGNGEGSSAAQLSRPYGVAADGSGNVYVSDVLNHRIQKWAPGAAAGVTVAGGNGGGSRADQLYLPYGVAVDRSGNVYVADVGNHRVQRWTPGAPHGVTVAGGKGAGGNADQLNQPFGVAVDESGNLYVADMNNHRIQKWAPNARAGVTAAGGNGAGNGAGQLSRPQGVAVDGSGNLYVADYNNHRIQQWTPGMTAGVTVAGGNGAGVNANQLNHPSGVIVDVTGNVYVADAENHRIQQWAPGATAGVTVAGGKGDGGNADQFNYPFGVATDGRGNLYVADMLNHRVQQFSPSLDAAYTPAEAGAYSATVTTFSGCAAEAAPVVVTEAVLITTQPEGAAKCAGESVGMSVAVAGVNLSYQWQRNGMDIEGATGATYQIASVKPGDAGNYRVMIGSDCGTIASAVAALTVTTPTATLRSSAAGNRINADQAITFTAAPASAAHYQFFVGATPVQSGASETYTTSALTNGAVVTVKVTTAGGCTATSAGLSVAVNAIPVAGNDAYEVDENQVLTLAAPGVLGNDTDADGDALTAALVPGSATAHGSLTFNADGSFTYVPVPYYHGPDAFTYAVRDGRGGSTTATVRLTVRPVNDAPVVTTSLAAQTVQYSDPVKPVALTATDADNDALAATAAWRKAGEIPFTAGLPAGLTLSAAAPNAWTMAGKMTLSPGVYIVRVTVGDGTSSGNSSGFADVTITVTGEDAVTTYTGTTFAFTAGTRATTAGVLLSATIQDVSATGPADASPGDIRKAAVSFHIVQVTSSGETFVKEVPAASLTYVNPSDTRTAIATANWTADIGAADAAMFKAYVLVDGSYRENPVNIEAITVSKPLADFVVGGGSVLPSAPAGLLAGTGVVMGKTSFGVSIKYAKNGSSPKGFVNLFIRRKINGGAQVLQVKSNAFSSFGVQRSTPARSTVVTKASVQEIGPAGTVDWGGNYTVSLSLVDNGNPGTKDLIGITIYDKDNQLWYAASWSGVKTLEQNLISGGLSINSSSSFATTPSARVSAAEEVPVAGVSLVSYPNPFSEATTVAFSLPESGDYTLEVYDAKGVRVARLKQGQAVAGEVNRVEWQAGKTLSGVYLLRLTTRAGVQHLKLLLR